MSESVPDLRDDAEGGFRPDDIVYRLDLTAGELKIVHTALKVLFDDLGHDEDETLEIVRSVLGKLPDAHSIRAINLTGPRRHGTGPSGVLGAGSGDTPS